MFAFFGAITFTALYYSIAAYMSYISVGILYTGIKYKLIEPTVKTIAYISACYISIIADVLLFYSLMYSIIFFKNAFFTFLSIFSIIYAKKRGG